MGRYDFKPLNKKKQEMLELKIKEANEAYAEDYLTNIEDKIIDILMLEEVPTEVTLTVLQNIIKELLRAIELVGMMGSVLCFISDEDILKLIKGLEVTE